MQYSRGWTYAVIAAALSGPMATRAVAQAPDNRGTEFILAFIDQISFPNLRLFIAGDTATTGTVAIPGLSFSTGFSITPGTVSTVVIPSSAMVTVNDATTSRGIHVTAGAEVAVYGLNQAFATTDALLGLPTDILNTEYIVLGYEETLSARSFSPLLGPSEFGVVGVVDGTTVTITPSVTTGIRTAGVPYNITLNRFEVYQLKTDGAREDLSGTIISSTQPVAVFGGNRCTDMPVTVPACDHVVEQIPPTATWGTSFLTEALATRLAGDVFRIIARDDATQVLIDGVAAATINRGQFHEFQLASNSRHLVQASGPSLLAQYSKGSTADFRTSDPFMMIIPPTEQFQTSYTVSTPAANPVSFRNFVNVVLPTADIPALLLDGVPSAATFNPIGATGFSAAQIPVSLGAHSFSAPNGLGVYSYGFAFFDSYGYPGGLALSPIAEAERWMNGGGSIVDRGTSYRHAFVMQCSTNKVPNNMQIHWDQNRFRFWQLKTVKCSDDPNIGEEPPVAGFDTIEGTGTGWLNGTMPANISFKMTDAGQPGFNDTFSFTITWNTGSVSASGKLRYGNHQAHQKMNIK